MRYVIKALLKMLGWTVEWEWQILRMELQGTPRLLSDGYPSKDEALKGCKEGEWVRCVVSVWRDVSWSARSASVKSRRLS